MSEQTMIQPGRAGIIHSRKHLSFTAEAVIRGKLNVGFIGGSITAFEDFRSWTEPVINYLMTRFPQCKLSAVNSAIGATKSEYGVFRADEDLVQTNRDLVFIEYAVNDNGDPTDYRMRTREGLVRKLYGKCDIVFVYTFCQEMYQDMVNGIVPASIIEFETIAEHYGIPSVWMGLSALRENMAGLLRWDEWLPDGTHPAERGSYAYGKAVIDYLDEEFSADHSVEVFPEVEKLQKDNWEHAVPLPFDEVAWKAPWSLRYNRSNMGSVNPGTFLYTSAIGAELEVKFEGTGLLITVMTGKLSGEFDWSVDGGPWQPCKPLNGCDEWQGKTDWYRNIVLADKLAPGKHVIQIKTRHCVAPGSCGTRILIKTLGVIK